MGRDHTARAVIQDNDVAPSNRPPVVEIVRLLEWESLEANFVTDDAIHFVDPEAPDLKKRFYRVQPASEVEIFDEE